MRAGTYRSYDKETVKNGPAFDDDREITPGSRNEVYSYYGLQRARRTVAPTPTTPRSDDRQVGRPGHDHGRLPRPASSASTQPTMREYTRAVATSGRDEDELRVQSTEEELAAGTREREAGQVNVRKRVRTDRERIEVPTRREEVTVERVPVSEGTRPQRPR